MSPVQENPPTIEELQYIYNQQSRIRQAIAGVKPLGIGVSIKTLKSMLRAFIRYEKFLKNPASDPTFDATSQNPYSGINDNIVPKFEGGIEEDNK
jgi:hypothetical protein